LLTINASITGTNQRIDTSNTNLLSINAGITGIKSQTDKLQFDASNNLKIQIQNSTTTNNSSITGINIYAIYPKKKSYLWCGIQSSASANTMLTGAGANVNVFSSVNWGGASLKIFYAYLTTGGITKNIDVEYVNSGGNMATLTNYAVTTTTGNVAMLSNIIGINKIINTPTVTNQTFATTDNLYITTTITVGPTATVANPSYYHMGYSTNFNSTFTVPNNKIAVIKTFHFFAQATENVNIYVFDYYSNRSLINSTRSSTNFTMGPDNIITLQPLQTVIVATELATATSKHFYSQIELYDT
jgi:hypothetical protein